MRVACIIQARLTSKRLPGKVHMDIAGKSMLERIVERVALVVPDWGVAWPSAAEDENDVLARYARIATKNALDAIIRVTGDCPLLDPQCITDVLYSFQTYSFDYVTNDYPRTYPCGLGVEIFSKEVLHRTNKEAKDLADREHVSLFMQRDSRNKILNIPCPIKGLSDLKLSVDTQEDLDFVRAIYAAKPRNYTLAATLEAINRLRNTDEWGFESRVKNSDLA